MKPNPKHETSLLTDEPISVSQLNREARYLLEENFASVLVEGEISNIAMPASGHWYLTLKDNAAQVRCAMFRNRNQQVKFKPEDGMQILLKAKLSLYEGRGDYQLIVERMEILGDGALRQAFEALKDKLLLEGLFDDKHKQAVPTLPRHIGVITSATGAAIRDITSVLERRFPAIPITVLPVAVQGESSAREMIRAIKIANARRGTLHDLDVLIIGRGGGSLEDLWSFNDEQLARSIFASTLPIVSAVGHEVDFTIADFVADLRAATPSAAAELLSPDQQDFASLIFAYKQQFAALMRDKISQKSQQLGWLSKQLRHPGSRLQEQAQKLDEIEARLRRGFHNRLYRISNNLKQLSNTLRLHSPLISIQQYRQNEENLHLRLRKAMRQLLNNKKHLLSAQSYALDTISPLSTLSRGYSISYSESGEVINNVDQISPGATMRTHLHRGEIISTVKKIARQPGRKKS
ncbi:exodeoxyribonuclease VII large subunit [Gammaproteobacteria bacterium]|nr:exodeoxyribonuclease VII large subunit [Gammaproteobacteria bacterium]